MTDLPGKRVAARTYLHICALAGADADPALLARLAEAERISGQTRGEGFNVVRLETEGPGLALLQYPDFFDDPFPALAASWRVDPVVGTASLRTYAESLNPPILHRKELLLPAEHPRRAEYEALTRACESIGLFDEPTRIGYRRQWLALVRERGYRIADHSLVPIGNEEEDDDADGTDEAWGAAGPTDSVPTADAALRPQGPGATWQAARQLTALSRYGFSAPIQALARHGFLDGRLAVFDYGCGRGDDVRGLAANGIEAAGWDPYYAPANPIFAAPIVNLGFVINVIEDRQERLEALTAAWSLAQTVLAVSVMLASQSGQRGTGFGDGVMTRRGTFQRYYTQAEIRAYLAQALDEEPIPVAPGVLFLFRDKEAEQRFLMDRYRSRRPRLALPPAAARTRPERRSEPRPRPERPERAPRPPRDRAAERLAAHGGAFERLWELWLALGRRPEPEDLPAELPPDLAALVEEFGSLNKALRLLSEHRDQDGLARAESARRADLLVYLALELFERRRPYKRLEPGLQRDIRALFGDYGTAIAQARALLFSIRDTERLADACRESAERGLGWLEPGHSLQLHASLVERLPPLLRVYVGAAAALYGDLGQTDLVKLHIGSGKVSLMRYDDFAGSALPRLLERVKVRLREQEIDFFAYGKGTDFPPPYLFGKSRFIDEEFPGYPEQAAFDEALEDLRLCDLSGHGPDPETFERALARRRWRIEGYRLLRPAGPPDLDAPCGRFLTFRQLIECGETQARTGMPNLPREGASWDALQELAERVLDPVIDWFGMIRLTYGFCSPELAREIPGRIDPRLDQHAACEKNRLGKPVCPRLGAAADFIVEDEDMAEVARWIAEHTPFDRLYFYGPDLPIHVSHGPEHNRQIVRMVATANGRLVPRVMTAAELTKP